MLPYSHISALYVAPDGDAAFSGTSPVRQNGDGPLPSIEEALARIASLRRVGVRQPIAVRLLPGTYEITAPISADESVSGVTLEPCGDGEVILAGGRQITGFAPDVFNGTPCLSAAVPAGMRFSDFYVNGRRAKMTRWPAEGFLAPESVEPRPGDWTDGSRWFIAKAGDFLDFHNIEDCIVSYNHFWIDEHSPIEHYDPETRRVTMAYRSRFTLDTTKPDAGSHAALFYCVENVAEMFKNPGEWYYDRPAGRVYYIPEDDSVTAESITAFAPVTDRLFTVAGKKSAVTDIRLRHLTLAYTRGDYASLGFTAVGGDTEPRASDAQSLCNAGGVIEFSNAENCSLEGCTLGAIGLHGVFIGGGTSDICVEDTVFEDCGMGAVRISGAPYGGDEAQACHHHTVTRCRMTAMGRRYSAACGVLIMHAHHCEVSNCEISDLYYSGISVGWVWGYAPSAAHHNRILNNHIHDLGKGVLSDMGGVYLLGIQPGTVVSGNVIHDVKSAHYGGWALYTDEGSSEITIERNICYDVSENCYHQHYGSMNTVRNNIFAFSGGEPLRVMRQESHLCILFENNIVHTCGKAAYSLYRRQIVEGTVASCRNHYCGTGETHISRHSTILTFAEGQALGFDTDSEVIPDPFMDAENRDFRLKTPIDGFVPIEFPKTGPRLPML